MAEPQIPANLIERIRAGRAALVVGGSIGTLAGLPSWKKVLERLRDELGERKKAGDKEAVDDVSALLKKGRLVSAAGFLARTLGGEACDAILAEQWKSPDLLPDAVKVFGRIPARAIWTTFPGDLIDRAVAEGSPIEWPAARVATYAEAGDLDTRKRYVLKALGDLADHSFVVVPTSVRRAIAPATSFRGVLQDLYRDGALVFVGFRHGDPDLHAMLDRVFGNFEPPTSEHYFVSAGLGPVDTEELSAEHHMTVIPLEGQGGDEKSLESLISFLNRLADECDKAGLTLAVTRPSDDDLDAWLGRLGDDATDEEALAAVDAIEAQARQHGPADRLIEVLMGRVEVEHDAGKRAAMLRDVARAFEQDVGDLPRAFTALTAALREDPTSEDTIVQAERLAAETEAWGELVTDLSEIVPQIADKKVAAGHWARLGRWYHEKLRHDEYAIASLREAFKLDPQRVESRERLEELYRKHLRWGDLAEELAAHADLETDAHKRVDVLLALGDLYETQLASTSKAIEAYERVTSGDLANADALAALERLYRRGERWGNLARVLEKRAELFDTSEPGRAASYRKELASLRSEKLGDVEGAIGRYEKALAADERDVEALRALEKLYEKVGRNDDYQRILERLAELAPEGERASMWRRLAAEVEDRDGGAERAIRYYENVLVLEPGAIDAYRSLERLYRATQHWDQVVKLYERHITAVTTPAQRVELWAALGKLHEQELADPHRAIEAHGNALDLAPDHRESLTALARLLRRVEAWDRAVETLTRHAELDGQKGTDKWHEAGQLLATKLHDPVGAEHRYEKALELDSSYLPAMLSLVELYRKRQDWAHAAGMMIDASQHTQNRLERIKLIYGAALLHEDHLEQPEKAAELYARVLTLDPEHVDAGSRAAEHYVAKGMWAEAEPVLEMLARKADPDDKVERGRREALYGRALKAMGQADKAARRLRAAVELDPDSFEAAVGLADLLFDKQEWVEADKRYREVLTRHRPALAESQVVEIWHRLGVIAKGKNDLKAAEDAFRRALERDPGHPGALANMIELASSRGDWKTVVDARRSQMEGVSDDERFRLLEEIGDLYAQKLEDPVTALGAYLEALKLKPRSHSLLHKSLEIYTEQRQWRRAVETLLKLAEQEKDAARRAKYYYTAAVISRDEMKEAEEAVEHFSHALDDAPSIPKAFEAVEKILGEKGDWKGLVRAYRKMIKRLGDSASEEQLLQLWSRLGDIASDKLGDTESAIAAYEVAASFEPNNPTRREQLAKLYLAGGTDATQNRERIDKAVTELQFLLHRATDRLDIYKTLSRLYVETNQLDKAYCVAAALVVLGHASEEEKARYQALRPKTLTPAKRRLTEELWQKAILHPREDRALNGVFGALMASLAATTAQPHSALDLNLRDKTDVEKDGRMVSKVFRYAAQVLGIQPTPELYLRPETKDGIRAANVAEKGVLTPAVLIGEPYVSSGSGPRAKNEREVAFDLAKKLAFFRPERYVYYALPTVPKLEAAFSAALAATGTSQKPSRSEDAEKLAKHIRSTVPASMLEQIAVLARKLAAREGDGLVTGWVTATDLTANRVGLILADDLETAARCVATEQGAVSTLNAKDRLRDLLAYACSEEYFAVRRHLGQEVSATGSAS
jgi:tetratricopeptide (TPR) repeat protein